MAKRLRKVKKDTPLDELLKIAQRVEFVGIVDDEHEDIRWRGSAELVPFLVPVDQLELDPFNPNIHPEKDLRTKRASWGEHGQQKLLKVLADGTVKTGNGGLMIAREFDWTHVAVAPFGGSEERARVFAINDNRAQMFSVFDEVSLQEQLRELEGNGADLAELFAFDAKELEELGLLDATPPPEFPSHGPDPIETKHECPKCGYEWS